MNKTKQVLKCLLLPALFLVLTVGCKDEVISYKDKPGSMVNTVWAHRFPQGFYTYYFSDGGYQLIDESRETVYVLDSGAYTYTYETGKLKLYPDVPADEEGNRLELDGYFEEGFICIDQVPYGIINYQRIQ